MPTLSVIPTGGGGDDYIEEYIQNSNTGNTDGDFYLSKSTYVDGEGGDDFINIYGYPYRYYGNTIATAIGGPAMIPLASQSTTNIDSSLTSVSVDGGDGNDKITVAGALLTTISTGSGRDTIVLTAAQYQQLLAESINIFDSDGNTSVTPEPFTITDFSTGIGGDLIDYGDLLRNATTAYDGSNLSPLDS